MNGELAGGDFLYKNVDVVAALEGILSVRAQVRVACIGFEVVSGKTVVLKPVEGFARMLREAVDGFLQGLVFAVGDDVVGKCLPVVLALRVGLLHSRAAGREEAAAEVRARMVGREALVEDFDLGAAVECLAGGHEARTAAAENDDVGFNIPLGGEFILLARGMSERGGGSGSGS